MKAFKTILILSAVGSLVVGCAEYKKDPVDEAELEQLRYHHKTTPEKGPQKPQTISENIVVTKDNEVVQKKTPSNQKPVVVSVDKDMTFIEGQESSYNVQVSTLVPGMKVELAGEGLPAGAKIEKTEQAGLYKITWKPALNSMAVSETRKSFKIKIVATVVEAPTGNIEGLKGYKSELDEQLELVREQKNPTELEVVGLPSQVQEGTVTPFSVTAVVPNVDDKSPKKPTLKVSYNKDGENTPGSNYLELDGKRHIIADEKHMEPEYLGNFKWKFSMMFDTKNVGPSPARSKDNKVIANATVSPVRMNFKVESPFGSSSEEVVKRLNVSMVKAVTTPRFDFSGLGAETLALVKGETNKFNFIVSSPHPKALIKVEAGNLAALPGKPAMACAADKKVPAQQNCTLTWKVPCDATDAQLSQELAMTAIAQIQGKNTEPAKQSLKTSVAANSKCKTPTTGAKP